jgi:tetratricopeptide (TPR) repeat protein
MLNQTFLEELDFIYIFQQGQQWFTKQFLPEFEAKAAALAFDKLLIGDTYATIGDIYDFNGAPALALAAYEKALEFTSEDLDIMLDCVLLKEQLGQYQPALELINHILEVNPDDEELYEVQSRIEEALVYAHEPEFTDEHLTWTYCEWLEAGETDRLIKFVAVQKSKDADVLKCLANAYAAEGNVDAYKDTWLKMLALKGERFNLSYADWFYMPEAIYNDTDFWATVESKKDAFDNVALVHHNELDEEYPELTGPQLIEFAATFYRAKDNPQLMQNLKKQYNRFFK